MRIIKFKLPLYLKRGIYYTKILGNAILLSDTNKYCKCYSAFLKKIELEFLRDKGVEVVTNKVLNISSVDKMWFYYA